MRDSYCERLGPDGICSVDLFGTDGDPVLVSRVTTTASYRGRGAAGRVMRLVLADADAEGKTLVLDVVAEGRECDPDDVALRRWYRRLGFEDERGGALRRRPRMPSLDPVVRVVVERVGLGAPYSEIVKWRAEKADGEVAAVSETAWLVSDRHDRRKLVEWIRRLFPEAILVLPWSNA